MGRIVWNKFKLQETALSFLRRDLTMLILTNQTGKPLVHYYPLPSPPLPL